MNGLTNLEQLAEQIVDVKAVDWTTIRSDASTPYESDLVEHLQLIAQIAACHRLLDEGEPAPTVADRGGSMAGLRWRHLRLLERVAEGAFGEVYRAWDDTLDREVALKLLKNATPESRAGIVEEGRLLARVQHPHIVSVYGADQVDGQVGIWMEFIHGRPLSDVLAEDGTFSAQEAPAIGIDVCRALTAIHGAGLLHRDIKAQNVMRERGGRLVVMDFGTGLDSAAARERVGIAGTPVYVAPEILSGGAPSVRSDIYSLGVLLFRLVTNQYPVAGRTLVEVRDTHARQPRTALAALRSDLPAEFVATIERATAADPARRFESAASFEQALAACRQADADVRLAARRRRAEQRRLAAALVVIAVSVVAWIIMAPPRFDVRPSIEAESGGQHGHFPDWITGFSDWDDVEFYWIDRPARYTFVTTNSAPALFRSQPTIGHNGVLSFVAWPHAFGTSTVTVTLIDQRRPFGLAPASTSRSFDIALLPSKVAPVAAADRYATRPGVPLDVGRGLPLDDQVATGPLSMAIGSGDFSVAFLVSTNVQRRQPLISYEPGCAPTGGWLGLTDATADGPAGRVLFEAAGAVSGHFTHLASHRRVDDGGVHAVVLVREGASFTLFVDGILDDSHAAPAVLTFAGQALAIGSDGCPQPGSRGDRFSGTIDRVSVFNRALSPGEVERLYLAGVLLNDSNVSGDRMTAELVEPPAHGAVQLRPDGTFTYEPVAGFVGTDTFTYRVRNASGILSAPAMVSVAVRAAGNGSTR